MSEREGVSCKCGKEGVSCECNRVCVCVCVCVQMRQSSSTASTVLSNGSEHFTIPRDSSPSLTQGYFKVGGMSGRGLWGLLSGRVPIDIDGKLHEVKRDQLSVSEEDGEC